MAGDERSRLHEIVDELSEEELTVARQLLELLSRGLAAPRLHQAASEDQEDEGDEDEVVTSPETLAKLAQLTDEELIRLDGLLQTDRDSAKQFWRQRFGEELPDDDLVEDGRR